MKIKTTANENTSVELDSTELAIFYRFIEFAYDTISPAILSHPEYEKEKELVEEFLYKNSTVYNKSKEYKSFYDGLSDAELEKIESDYQSNL